MSRLVSWLTEQAYRRAAIVIIAVVYNLADGMRNRVARRFGRGVAATPATALRPVAGSSTRMIQESGEGT
ncbi:MAG TPA: hypothetical protein VFV93_18510 [Thermomicrobiales bacterium]|nr:hypothetical protein [Thermomicrobiales bacterium]